MKIVQRSELKEEPVSHNPQLSKTVWIRKGTILHLVFLSETKIPAGKIVAAHTHKDMTEVFMIIAGEGLLQANGKANKIRAGVCVVVEPGDSHAIENTGEQT